jgi:ferredoxin
VKPRCNFDVYRHESEHNRNPLASIQTLYECKACFSCVQSCTKGLLSLSVNPEFLDMGDDYWKPDIILSTWNQADGGKIPVSGAGYRGRFHGPGFDSIWTDMSEIVRPTRDGIHGREYISTSVDVGIKPMRLNFTSEGKLQSGSLNVLELQVPAILDLPSWPMQQSRLALARSISAKELKTIAAVYAPDAVKIPIDLLSSVLPVFRNKKDVTDRPNLETIVRIAQLCDGPEVLESAETIQAAKPHAILSVRLPLAPGTADRILELSSCGIKVFQICADQHGQERKSNSHPKRHIKDALRQIHHSLVQAGVRDEITLIISGGIALAEHMAKAIICGADLVSVDTALLSALGCRVCRNADAGICRSACPIRIESIDSEYAARRMTNLMGAWHSQLIEVLGAMGIREVRRLRGEMGRAIFMEEIEKEAFNDLLQVVQERATA